MDRPESRLARQKSPLEPPDMEDRTSGRIGSLGFSRIRRVWVAGCGLRLGFSPRVRRNSSIAGFPGLAGVTQPPIMEDRSSLDSRVHRSELLVSAPSRHLSLSPDPPDPLSVSRSHLSNLSHLPLTQSLISVSLSPSRCLCFG